MYMSLKKTAIREPVERFLKEILDISLDLSSGNILSTYLGTHNFFGGR